MIHGAGASSAIWMMVLARLGRVTRAVAIDLPGHGPSPNSDGAPLTIARYRDASGLLAATLCLGRSVLVGHSMGALVAIEAALAWPDKVAGLVLCGAAPRLPVSDELQGVVRDDYAQFPAWLAARALSPAAKPAVRRGFMAAGTAAPRESTLADYTAIAATDLSGRLADVRAPILWLDGADDHLVTPAPAADRPGEVITLAGVGHLTPLEAPAAVAEAAARLLAGPTHD